MRSKVIFVVLFMLSFTVMHDTFINIVHTDTHNTISYMSTDVISPECSDINEVHNIFHFVGLMSPYKSTFEQLLTEKKFSLYLLQYNFGYEETSFKPPIA